MHQLHYAPLQGAKKKSESKNMNPSHSPHVQNPTSGGKNESLQSRKVSNIHASVMSIHGWQLASFNRVYHPQ